MLTLSRHHSARLPAISWHPTGDTFLGCSWIDVARRTLAPHSGAKFANSRVGGSSPHGYVRFKGPLAAYSHWASVGREPPAHRANATASHQLTPVTGMSSSFQLGSYQ